MPKRFLFCVFSIEKNFELKLFVVVVYGSFYHPRARSKALRVKATNRVQMFSEDLHPIPLQ